MDFDRTPHEIRTEYLDKNVAIKTKGGAVFEGLLYTYDPVTRSVVLLKGGDVVEIVFGHSITSMEFLDVAPPAIAPMAFLAASEQTELSDEEKINTRLKLKTWLSRNLLSVEEFGDELRLADNAVTIFPPYTPDNCLSTNEIVLDKVRQLITAMPDP